MQSAHAVPKSPKPRGESVQLNWPLMRNFTKPTRSPKHAAFRSKPKHLQHPLLHKPSQKTGLRPRNIKLLLSRLTVGNSEGNQTVILPANALDALAYAFKMLKGRG